MKKTLIFPSLLGADLSCLRQEMEALEKAGADGFHWDIMDSHFVPALTFGPCVVKALRPFTHRPFDVHLMVSRPETLVEAFAQAGANCITFHLEASPQPKKLLKKIKSLGVQAGLCINPNTPADKLFEFMEGLDLILLMTVEPGRVGQKFLKTPGQKLKLLKEKAKTLKNPPLIAVDGGINPKTARFVPSADILVSAGWIFSGDYTKQITALRQAKGKD